MSKKSTKALASATLMSLVLTTALSAGPVKAAAGQVTRAGGDNRYATAANLATTNWTSGSDNVVLVSGEGYADAVSATPLAQKLNAPILLTHSASLDSETSAALLKLKPKTIYIVGGNGAVSQSVRDSLKANGYTNLVELSGANRYDTNAAVAKELVTLGASASDVLMVGGENFPDALSVAPVAAAKGQILLLGMSDADHMKSVLDFVKSNSSKVTVVGTKNMISDDILSKVSGTRVDGGADRFATNLNILNKYDDVLKNDKMYIATGDGDNYPDALVAAAVAGKSSSPLVLVDGDATDATSNALAYIGKKATKTTDLNVVGGTGVVSDDLVSKINTTVNPTSPNPSDVSVGTIEATDLNQIKVTFNSDVDEDSAEDVSNYKLDGTTLNDGKTCTPDNNTAVATLLDDNRTVLITLRTPKEQQKSYTVNVKDGVLSADKTKSVPSTEKDVTFADSQAPTVDSVSIKGSTKLTVKFSEPVKMPVNYDSTAAKYRPSSTLASKFKINDQNITSFGLSYDDSEVKHAVATTSGAVWADQIDFYFSSKLPTGSNKFKVTDGNTDGTPVLCDAANYIVKEDDSKTFTVDTNTTAPTIKEVKADTNNTIWVRYDKPMDSKTATNLYNYGLNGDSNTGTTGFGSSATAELKENDCTVKIKHVANVNTNSNTLYIKNTIKDAYLNKVADDTRVSFVMDKDETKPTVTGVNMIDSETVRMTFSKDIDKNYATKLANYTLKDANGVDISTHIRAVKEANKSINDDTTSGAIAANIANIDDDNVWDIKMFKNEYDYQHYVKAYDPDGTLDTAQKTAYKANDWRLTNAKYTLDIKNLRDITANKNVMDDYTATINGTDDVAPKLNNAYGKVRATSSDKDKVVLTFSEEMDTSNITNLDNYKYKNKAGDSKQLPSDAKITVGNDNKTVTIEFPTNYYVNGNGSYSSASDDNGISGILASNLKDLAGNAIDSFNNSANISTTGSVPFEIKSNTYRITNDGDNTDDVLVKVQFTNAIDPDNALKENFKVAGETPDSLSFDGSDVVLRFNKDSKSSTKTVANSYTNYLSSNNYYSGAKSTDLLDKAEVVRLAGVNAPIQIVDYTDSSSVTHKLTDMLGNNADTATIASVKPYNYLVAPKTTSDYWFATDNVGSSYQIGSTTTAAVVLTFDSTVDKNNSGLKVDDFTFFVGGTQAKADQVTVKDNAVIFLFAKDHATFSGASNVSVTLNNKSIDLETPRDGNDDSAKYVPSTDDNTKSRTVNVSSNITLN